MQSHISQLSVSNDTTTNSSASNSRVNRFVGQLYHILQVR